MHRIIVDMSPPEAEVQSVVIYNDQDATTGRWIPMHIEVGSWVILQPRSRGPWVADARNHGFDGNARAWKAQVLQFRWGLLTVHGREIMRLEAAKVRHAYQCR
jgi:hypothetical protein